MGLIGAFKHLPICGNQSYNRLSYQQPTYSTPEIINHRQLRFSGVVKCGVPDQQLLFLRRYPSTTGDKIRSQKACNSVDLAASQFWWGLMGSHAF